MSLAIAGIALCVLFGWITYEAFQSFRGILFKGDTPK